MARPAEFKTRKTPSGWVVSTPQNLSADGKRHRTFFPTRELAEVKISELKQAFRSGVRGSTLSSVVAIQATEAIRILDGSGISLVEAARIAVAKLGGAETRETFRERYWRAMKANDGVWSDKYQTQMDDLPKWVPETFLDRVCGGVDRVAIEAACREIRPSLKQSSLDMKASRILAILNFRPRHRKLSSIAILSPGQVGQCLRVCETPEERRVVAVLFFAGIRPDSEFGEISRLEWNAFGGEEIYISRDVSKTPSDRHIPISGRLRRLIHGHPKYGLVMPTGWKKRWQRIRRDSGISSLTDVTRHTYCSNMLAAEGMEATQSAMGHVPLSQATRRHYVRAVLKSAAVRYFR